MFSPFGACLMLLPLETACACCLLKGVAPPYALERVMKPSYFDLSTAVLQGILL